MIDVGSPFSKPFMDLVNSFVESLQYGVEQPDTLSLLFSKGTKNYPLKGAGPVSGLAAQITGFVAGKPAIFNRDQHYVYASGQLVWQDVSANTDLAASWFPDDNSFLTVGYFYRDLPSGITDFNAGSVTGTLIRATSRELKLLYEQMDQAYKRAFIDYAQGVALDNVVALLGISRHQALPAQGEVTFSLKKAPKADVPITVGTRVADARGRLFKVTTPGLIQTALNQTSTTVQVVALDAGPEGNLGSGSLTVMPTPPRGVDGGVTNNKPLTGGEAAEADDQLRERAKHALERAGNATLNAIRFAVLSIDGVDSVDVRDFSVDETIPLGEVNVLFSTGKSDVVGPQVSAAVDKTRAAGIKARVMEVSTIILSGKFYVIPDTAGSGKVAYDNYLSSALTAISSLGIGEPVSLRRLAALAFQIAGLADVGEIQLDYVRGTDAKKPVGADPFVINAGEQARPDSGALSVVPIWALKISSAALAVDATFKGTLSATLSATDQTGASIQFVNFQLAVLATIRATPTATPDQPPQQITQVAGMLVFAKTGTTTLTIPAIPINSYKSLDATSFQVSIQSAAYAGIQAATMALKVTGP